MSRTIRMLLAGAALAGVVAPLSAASAGPEPFCRFYWGDPLVTTSSDFPVQVEVRRLAYAC
ncbi:MAG TPA: hypothetical protein VGX28_13360 [Frankiaceae bacterium]|jgi:hypothetical protein|nr:hypothetical protein [Frankiaceae bacterium]